MQLPSVGRRLGANQAVVTWLEPEPRHDFDLDPPLRRVYLAESGYVYEADRATIFTVREAHDAIMAWRSRFGGSYVTRQMDALSYIPAD